MKPGEEDKYIDMVTRFGEEMFAEDAPGSHLTDILPICTQSFGLIFYNY